MTGDGSSLVAYMTAVRRELHALPELSDEELLTSQRVAKELELLGLDVQTGVGGNGVVGVLRRGAGRRISLRADIDALPIHELGELPHRSARHGVMHACGHDGHTAMLLGAAKNLSQDGELSGTINFIFQPAEENARGAVRMIEDGLFHRFPTDAVFALHNWPSLPAGTFGVRSGPIMASCSTFRVTFKGVGGHGARPEETRDPVFALIQASQAIQGILTRNKPGAASAVLSITYIKAGDSLTVIPGEAEMGGTVRTYETSTLDLIESRLRAICSAIAEGFGCSAVVTFNRTCTSTINDPHVTSFATSVMREVAGSDQVFADVPAAMTGDDFGYMAQQVPSCYAFLGSRGAEGTPQSCALHSAHYDFNDQVLLTGARYWVALAKKFLGQPAGEAIAS